MVGGKPLLPLIPGGALLFGNLMVLSGSEGLKFELEGKRFVGDVGRDALRGLDEVYKLKGGLDFEGLGDGGIRETVFD